MGNQFFTPLLALGTVLSLLAAAPAGAATVINSANETSLRNAIAAGGLVQLAFDGTITLTSTLEVTKNVVLDARNHAVIISGNDAVRLFHVNPGISFSATNLVLTKGFHTSPPPAPNQAGGPGEGAVFLNEGGNISLNSCTLSNSRVVGRQGGTNGFSILPSGDGRGAAIATYGGTLNLDSVIVVGNTNSGGPTASVSPGGAPFGQPGVALGGALFITNATVVLANCQFGSNYCFAPNGAAPLAAQGGALYLASGTLVATNTLFNGNTAEGENGVYYGTGYSYPAAGYGGSLAALAGTILLDHCQVLSNKAIGGNAQRFSGAREALGGALYTGNNATFQAIDSTFANNEATAGNGSDAGPNGSGGALYNLGTASFNRCSLLSNHAVGGFAGTFGGGTPQYPGGHGFGGGIFNRSHLDLINCTLALNVAEGGLGSLVTGPGPGGPPGQSLGAGLYNTNPGTATVVNCTLAHHVGVVKNNNRVAGTTLYNDSGSVRLSNSILAYPTGSPNVFGSLTEGGNNLISDASAAASLSSSLHSVDPLLKSLGSYGGPTLTYSLATNSPALNAGNSAVAPSVDQRGFMRPVGAAVDIGSVEDQNVTSVLRLSITRLSGQFQLGFSAKASQVYALSYSTNLTNWTTLKTTGPHPEATNFSWTLPIPADSQRFFRIITQ